MKDNLLYKRCSKLEQENKRLKEEITHLDSVNCHLRKKINNDIYKKRNEKATKCIKDFLCTEEYNKVDGKAIADNYMEVLKIFGGSDE